MNNERFNNVMQAQLDYCEALLSVKGKEYDADSSDRLHQFKVAADMQHITPKQALAGMMAKHTVSLYDMCAEGDHDYSKWREKITDSINYLLLLNAMVLEESEEQNEANTSRSA